jgi:uncharacterized repeat protein (TIGR03803 family)
MQVRNSIPQVHRGVACGGAKILAAALLCAVVTISAPAQTFTTLASFGVPERYGYNPKAPLAQGLDGNFYGTAFQGGLMGLGTVFKITPGGTLAVVHYFGSQEGEADGYDPQAGLVLARNGKFYGVTGYGGSGSYGTAFAINQRNTIFTLYNFDPNGDMIGVFETRLLQATNGNLYGYTGPQEIPGTIFEITPAGQMATLYAFQYSPGGNVPQGWLIQATDGNLYGITSSGGSNGWGTVFKISLSGTLTTLHNFTGADGGGPHRGAGAGHRRELLWNYEPGRETQLQPYQWLRDDLQNDSRRPTHHAAQLRRECGLSGSSALVQATDGNFYGTTPLAGTSSNCMGGCGTIFKITATGVFATLHSFDGLDGACPEAALLQGTDGNFYGTTYAGGAYSAPCAGGCGTVFRLSIGAGPFVTMLPTSARVGCTVKILGTDLTGTTSVGFNGKTAAFTVVSATEITVTVPMEAKTGAVKVTTPTGTLTSNVAFTVLP